MIRTLRKTYTAGIKLWKTVSSDGICRSKLVDTALFWHAHLSSDLLLSELLTVRGVRIWATVTVFLPHESLSEHWKVPPDSSR